MEKISVIMSLKKLVNKNMPFLEPQQSVSDALSMMDEFKVSHLPVVRKENAEYLGLVSEDDILDMDEGKSLVENVVGDLKKIFIDEDRHILEVLEVISEEKIPFLPVLSRKEKYLGVITHQTLIDKMAEATSANQKGGIIEIETDAQNYSAALITGISENNSMKVMSLLTRPHGNKGINAVIKLNGPDTSGVIQGLERYGYKVKNVYQGDSKYSSLMKERYDALLSYLNV